MKQHTIENTPLELTKTLTVNDAKEMAFKCWMEALDVDWQCIPKGEYPVEFLRAWDKINPDE